MEHGNGQGLDELLNAIRKAGAQIYPVNLGSVGNLIDEEAVEAIDSKAAVDLAIGAAAGASNQLAIGGADGVSSRVSLLQEQSLLWLKISNVLNSQEVMAQRAKEREERTDE